MKAVLLTDSYKVEIVDVERPQITDTEVLVEVRSNGICGSDVHAYRGLHPFRKPPVILGHEVSGTIVELGRAVDNVAVGDRVAVEPQSGCGQCAYCLAGRYNLCIKRAAPGIAPWNGTFAEYFAAPASKVYPLPEDMSYDTGALMEPLAVGVHAVRTADVKLGDSVAILGMGTIGLMNLVAARRAGAARIYASDLLDYNLGKAGELGADTTVNSGKDDLLEVIPKSDPWGVDKVIITAAFPPVWTQAQTICKKGGTVCVVGMFGETVTLDLLKFLLEERQVRASWLYLRRDFEIAIDIARRVNLGPMITHRLRLEDAARGLKIMDERKENIVKIILNS